MSSRWLKNGFIYLLVIVAIVAVMFMFLQPGTKSADRPLSTAIEDAKTGRVEAITVQGDSLKVKLKEDATTYNSRKESGSSLIEILNNAGVKTGSGEPGAVQVIVKEPGNFSSNTFGLL